MNGPREIPSWNRPALVGLMCAQAVCVLVAMWYGWGVLSFAQWITPAAACLTVNASILASLRRDAKRNHL